MKNINKIRDIGIKYLGLGLTKLIKLNDLIRDIGIKYLGLGLTKLIKLNDLTLRIKLDILELNNYDYGYLN